ncbi:MAG TPA: hypothetical protein VE591_10095 [Candidatus Acidoferrum sp.]|nr:hypothetical protein [Candidatus Acidoferrum sp.]
MDFPVATAIAVAMRRVASTDDVEAPGTIDRQVLAAAWTHLLGRHEPLDQDRLPHRSSEELAQAIADAPTRELALRFAVVAALVQARTDPRRLAIVRDIAAAWSLTPGHVAQLAAIVDGRLKLAIADIVRRDRTSFGLPFDAGPITTEFGASDNGRAEPSLAARFRALAARPPRTLGRAFYNHYVANGFRFPGERGALAESSATPHDAAHILSGYTASAQGELLVGTFTAAMHQDDPSGVILPALTLWHLGFHFPAHVAPARNWLEPEKFFVAWERGRATRLDLLGPEFVFWDNIDRTVDELRRAAGIQVLERRYAADGPDVVIPR